MQALLCSIAHECVCVCVCVRTMSLCLLVCLGRCVRGGRQTKDGKGRSKGASEISRGRQKTTRRVCAGARRPRWRARKKRCSKFLRRVQHRAAAKRATVVSSRCVVIAKCSGDALENASLASFRSAVSFCRIMTTTCAHGTVPAQMLVC